MANTLDDINGTFFVLRNAEEQYSLWPEPIAVPQGWTIAYGADSRQKCLAYVETHWTDMRPASLRNMSN